MTTPVVSLRNISKTFGADTVLHGVDLDVQRGEVVVIIGRSGSGKSTLLRCINYLEEPTEGSVLVDGVELEADEHHGRKRRNHIRQLRSKSGMVFQQFNLFPHMTVLENVIEAPMRVLKWGQQQAETAGMDWLRKVGLDQKAKEYPIRLSGGQQQRVAIARALAMRPKVMLFDEPTSALDPELIGEVLSVMKDIANQGDVTMVIVTHEMGFAREVADRVCFFADGRLVEQGPPEKIFTRAETPECRQFLAAMLTSRKETTHG